MSSLLEKPIERKETADQIFERRVELVMVAVDLHHTYLQDYLYRLTRQWQDAEDILADLWRYALLRFPEEKIQSLSLLRHKAYQLFVDHYRAGKRRQEIVTDEIPEPSLYVSREMSFSDVEETALKERFWREFPGIDLSETQKDVLFLHARYGFTYQELALQTGIGSSTIGDWVSKGRQLIADYLNANS